MAKFIDVTGKTEEEALKSALDQLGLQRDDVSVEILERAKAGFLGIGSRPAKIRVSYGLDGAEEPKAEAKPQPKPQPAKPQPKAAEKPAARENSRERSQNVQKENRGSRQENRKPRPQQEKAAPAPVAAEELGEICNDEKAQQIRTFLEGLLHHMESDATVKVYKPDEDRYKVILEGEKLGQLIGRRGETLDAIQQLASYSVNRGSDKRVRIHVDAENYRLKREESLQHLAHKVAAKVVKNHRNVTLEPMNAYERHVIHTALQDVEGVTTYSMGTEPNRRVIVAYEK